MRRWLVLCLAAACGHPAPAPQGPADKQPDLGVPDAWNDPEAYLPRPRRAPAPGPARPAPPPVVIRGGTILTATGKRMENGTLVLRDGKIAALGPEIAAPAGAVVVDARGRFVTPGLIDTHSHLGVAPAPAVDAHDDTNERVTPFTPAADAAFGYWAQDPQIPRALAGGVTAAQILPGSSNLMGGKGFIVEMHPGVGADAVAFPGAPRTLKMACGENPKRNYAEKGGPRTRMGEYAALRKQFQKAAEYNVKLREYWRDRGLWEKRRARAAELDRKAAAADVKGRVKPLAPPQPPPRDDDLEVVAAVLRGEVLVQVHCYRSDEILQMVRIADEFGFSIRSFHHALEAYKVRDVLVQHGIAISTWADWWGFKLESYDGIPENAALFTEAGGRVAIHSDSEILIQRLNQEAGKALAAGQAAGIRVTEEDALRWITINPAWILGIDAVTGSLVAGKRADVVVWSAHPFSVYSKADLVYIRGELVHDRLKLGRPQSDFELGNASPAGPSGGGRP